MARVVLYDCPPLSAKVLPAQCASNRSTATGPPAKRVRARSEEAHRLHIRQQLTLRPCLTCPGCLALARAGGKPPKVVHVEPSSGRVPAEEGYDAGEDGGALREAPGTA